MVVEHEVHSVWQVVQLILPPVEKVPLLQEAQAVATSPKPALQAEHLPSTAVQAEHPVQLWQV